MTKGAHVTYKLLTGEVSAIVRTCHRDGSVTVEATHYLEGGKIKGCYLGYRYRMDRADLRAAA